MVADGFDMTRKLKKEEGYSLKLFDISGRREEVSPGVEKGSAENIKNLKTPDIDFRNNCPLTTTISRYL